MNENQKLAIELAQEALRGFFDDPTGFDRMDSLRREAAIERVQKHLEGKMSKTHCGACRDTLEQASRNRVL